MKEIPYIALARQAVADRNFPLFWKIAKNHARVKRRQWAKERAAAVTATK